LVPEPAHQEAADPSPPCRSDSTSPTLHPFFSRGNPPTQRSIYSFFSFQISLGRGLVVHGYFRPRRPSSARRRRRPPAFFLRRHRGPSWHRLPPHSSHPLILPSLLAASAFLKAQLRLAPTVAAACRVWHRRAHHTWGGHPTRTLPSLAASRALP
jgi:hypothetical protein